MRDPAYEPLNVPKSVAENVWVVDAEPVHAAGIPLPVRMTVMRLAGGDLLLHSPVRWQAPLRDALERLGPIRHLVAPSVGHWMFLRAWQEACPEATTWSVPGLRDRAQVRAAGIRIDAELDDHAPADWAGEIDQVLVSGPFFKEVDLFHRPSRTLVLTDLIVNLEADRLPPPARLLARILGILAPDGRAPLYVRLLLKLRRREAAQAASRLIALEPDRVVFAHGLWFETRASERLRRSVAWLARD